MKPQVIGKLYFSKGISKNIKMIFWKTFNVDVYCCVTILTHRSDVAVNSRGRETIFL